MSWPYETDSVAHPGVTYALFDEQNKTYMHTGYGSEDLEELKYSLLGYISVDYDSDDPDWKKIQGLPVWEIAEMWEMSIHTGDFRGDYYIIESAQIDIKTLKLQLGAESIAPKENNVTIEVDAKLKEKHPRRRKDDQ